MNLRAKISLLVSAVALSAITSAASANSIQIYGTPVLSPSGADTNFAYSVQVTDGNEVDSGDFSFWLTLAGSSASALFPRAGHSSAPPV